MGRMALFGKSHAEKKAGRSRIALIFDIGSGSVGAALVQLRPLGKPTVIYSTRAELPFVEELHFKRFLSSMLASFKEVAVAVAKEKKILHSAINEIHCVFSSPWYISQTRVLKASSNKSIIVDEKYINKIINESGSSFKSSELSRYSGGFGTHAEPIEQRVIQIRLNGYETSHPYGKSANHVDISLYTSMVSRDIRLKIHRIVNSHFDVREIEYHSFALSAFTAIRDAIHDSSDFLFLDIGGEVTDVSLIRRGILLETISIPYGRNIFLRALTKASRSTLEETLSSLRLYSEGNLSKAEGKKLHDLFEPSERMWVTLFGEALRGLSNEASVPQKIFLSAASDIGSIFGSFIDSDEFRQYTLIEQRFLIVLMESDNADLFTETAPGVTKDTPLALEAAFLNKLHSQKL